MKSKDHIVGFNDHIVGFKDHILVCLLFLLFLVPVFGQKYSNGKQPSGWLPSRLAPHSQLRKGTKPNQVLMSLGDSTLKYVDADTASTIFGAELGWGKEGNAGISKHVNFIGTTDTGSFVIKANNIKIGDFSGYNKGVGLGQGANATGQNSGVLGWNSTASGLGSFAIGENATASGSYSVALGTNAVASGHAACSLGNTNLSSGYGSFSMGQETEAYGYASSSMGYVTKSIGKASFSAGYYTVGSGMGSAVFGTFNEIDVPADSVGINSSNRLFQIGNGTGISGNRSNALTVLQSGNIGIGTTTPSTKLDISGGANVSGLRLNGLSNSTIRTSSGNALGYDNSGNIVPIDGRNFKSYVFQAYKAGAPPMVVTVLENTTGATITWTNVGTGIFEAVISGTTVEANKFWSPPNIHINTSLNGTVNFGRIVWVDNVTFRLYIVNQAYSATSSFGQMDFEVRFYN